MAPIALASTVFPSEHHLIFGHFGNPKYAIDQLVSIGYEPLAALRPW